MQPQACSGQGSAPRGKGPQGRGEPQVSLVHRWGSQRTVPVELHNAKMSVCYVYLVVLNVAKRRMVALKSPRKHQPVLAETSTPGAASRSGGVTEGFVGPPR